MIDFAKLDIAVVTHNRPVMLQRCINRWAETAPSYRDMYVILNHPEGARGVQPPPRCSLVPTGRIPEHPGCMSKAWNLAMQWAFRDAETEWLLCSMDDLEVRDRDWPYLVNAVDRDLYMAPAGDLCFLMNRTVLRKVGWYDERFPVVAFQEWDWEARAIKQLGEERVSIHDTHGWGYNPVGLEQCWFHDYRANDIESCGRMADRAAGIWLEQKWGLCLSDFAKMMHSGIILDPMQPEVDWYPWFPR